MQDLEIKYDDYSHLKRMKYRHFTFIALLGSLTLAIAAIIYHISVPDAPYSSTYSSPILVMIYCLFHLSQTKLFLLSIKSSNKGIELEYYKNKYLKTECITWQEFHYELIHPPSRYNPPPYIKIKKAGIEIGLFELEETRDIYDLSYKLTKLKRHYLYGK
jgi:hypothetical protein